MSKTDTKQVEEKDNTLDVKDLMIIINKFPIIQRTWKIFLGIFILMICYF